jgi:UPF0176 protein
MTAQNPLSEPCLVAALYHFARVDTPEAVRQSLHELCTRLNVCGTLIVAGEGLNGTVAGSKDSITRLIDHLRGLPSFAGLEVKYSTASTRPFRRMKVRLKPEIVTMGQPDIDPVHGAGRHVSPREWNELISDPDTVVIDTRNDYETRIGTFRNAIDPDTATFRAFPAWVDANRTQLEGKKVAMFCTGGIRCEKATAYVRSLGIEEVFHLKGGILKYLEDVPESASLWDGECFVFDERVTVTHGLNEGSAVLCRACRMPVTPDERAHPDFVDGISCPHCRESRSEADRARFAERQKQSELAKKRASSY